MVDVLPCGSHPLAFFLELILVVLMIELCYVNVDQDGMIVGVCVERQYM